MDIQDMFYACRDGDLQRLQYLVETKDVDFDVRDKWDSSPLYWACLCGHKDVVQYLLEKGAQCKANTFDGERCLYGALTDEIRNILKSFNVISTRTIRRDMFEEFLRRLLEDSKYADIQFRVHGEEFRAHRCILSARCLFFARMIKTKWLHKDVVELNHSQMYEAAFKSILQYLYTGQLEVSMDLVEDCLRLAKQCELANLTADMENQLKKTLSWEKSKPGVKVTMFVLDSSYRALLSRDLSQLAYWAVPEELNYWSKVVGELPFEPETPMTYPDICFKVQEHEFMCHKVFFCGRSDYFKALVEDHFNENANSGDVPIIVLHDISVDVFVQILFYIYSDSCELPADLVADVLVWADMYLLVGLKRQCATALMQYVELDNVVHLIQMARLFNLPRLESRCAEFISNNLNKVIAQEEFKNLVLEDAGNVREREETDSIEIVDEIRYYITSFVLTYSDMEEANDKLRLIDDLLEDLNIDG